MTAFAIQRFIERPLIGVKTMQWQTVWDSVQKVLFRVSNKELVRWNSIAPAPIDHCTVRFRTNDYGSAK